MRWYVYVLLLLLTGVLSFSRIKLFPGVELIEPQLITCFLILRFEGKVKTVALVFVISLAHDFLVLGNQISGVSTLAILPLIYLGSLFKEHILPSFIDLFLLGYFFIGFSANYFLIRWLYTLFNVNISIDPIVFIEFRALGHTAVFGAILIILGRIKRAKR